MAGEPARRRIGLAARMTVLSRHRKDSSPATTPRATSGASPS
jgi:hypothetical protein